MKGIPAATTPALGAPLSRAVDASPGTPEFSGGHAWVWSDGGPEAAANKDSTENSGITSIPTWPGLPGSTARRRS